MTFCDMVISNYGNLISISLVKSLKWHICDTCEKRYPELGEHCDHIWYVHQIPAYDTSALYYWFKGCRLNLMLWRKCRNIPTCYQNFVMHLLYWGYILQQTAIQQTNLIWFKFQQQHCTLIYAIDLCIAPELENKTKPIRVDFVGAEGTNSSNYNMTYHLL